MIFLCFAYDINAGCDFDKKLGKFVKIQDAPDVKKKSPKQVFEPVMTNEQKTLLHIKLMNKRMDQERKQSKQ